METNTQKFTGRAEVYAKARPSYPDSALEYIASLVPNNEVNAVFADIGAGTGKFTECLAKQSCELFAVEPNDDMRKQLAITLSPFPNAKIINGTAEVTMLPDNSVDVITVAQALHWFEPDKFRAECRRIGKAGVIVIAIYNHTPEKIGGSKGGHRKEVLDAFFTNPTYREFPNPVAYTRESWLQFMSSHSRSPLPTEPEYAAHIAEMETIFARENVDGLFHRELVTRVWSEKL
ncbi:MAG: class I SAM-dependent methyltransferase [Oscillospiraceae bacterium]|nr:class I SAM-dependent methyltransferase [Oscillospiraceae bacterium]